MNILEKIKGAEADAAKIKAEATAKARTIARNGSVKAEDAAKEIIDSAKKKAAEVCDKAEKDGAEKAQEYISAKSREDAAKIKDAEKRYDKAVNYIVNEVQKL